MQFRLKQKVSKIFSLPSDPAQTNLVPDRRALPPGLTEVVVHSITSLCNVKREPTLTIQPGHSLGLASSPADFWKGERPIADHTVLYPS